MASLDISQDVPESFLNKKDEIGILAKSINKITLNLRDIIKNIGADNKRYRQNCRAVVRHTSTSLFIADFR